MSLHEKMQRHGQSLFRWRGYIPLLFIGPLILALKESVYFESIFGGGLEDIWVLVCFLISLGGLAIRCLTVGFIPGSTSGRNTREQRAGILNTSGAYSVVRNPLYLGNIIMILGVMLSIKVWWLVLIVALVFFIYMERIILTEEAYLKNKFGKAYEDYLKRTPVILPDFRLWHAPDMKFSIKTVFKREYPGLLAVATAFFLTEALTDLVVEHEPFQDWIREDIAWPVIYGTILVFCLTLRHLKKHTGILKVEGR